MTISYKTIVPWGRSLDEYCRMFSLTEADLALKILGCGDGPASFNYEMTKLGHDVISIDPIYQFTAEQIKTRIHETYQDVIKQTAEHQKNYIWTSIKSVEALGRIRMKSMTRFLTDFEKGKTEGRYITAELPNLPFKTQSFDLALCSHLLFLFSDKLDGNFHRLAIQEMLRIAKEVRIFPLQTHNVERSPNVDEMIKIFNDLGYKVEEIKVDYEFQKGANKMLKIKKYRKKN